MKSIQPEQIEKFFTDYGAVLAQRSPLGLVRDIRSLPYSKAQIKAALRIALQVTSNKELLEQLRIAYVSLGDFQELTPSEIHALQSWFVGAELEVMDTAIEVLKRASAEANDLVAELNAAGLWK